MIHVSDFHYELPEELIAQEPPAERGSSRMLVVRRSDGRFEDDQFANFHKYVGPGDCLVLNNTRVFPARLHGRRNSEAGAEVELFLVRALSEDERTWNVLAKPAKRVRTGDRVLFGEMMSADVLAESEYGERTVRFVAARQIGELFEEFGRTPLPPYIHREPSAADRERYQTVFAREKGSIAAPTAGLHFTPEMLDKCREAGAAIAYVTLHVGLGTFAPLREEKVADIRLHEEHFAISEENAEAMRRAGRLVCVGTTSARTLETAMLRGGMKTMDGETNLFISPGFHFRAVGALLTNFHLPESSLLMLVCAFGGYDLTLAAYRHAVAKKYRFFSYGDCMLMV